jgi:hypothetical protein
MVCSTVKTHVPTAAPPTNFDYGVFNHSIVFTYIDGRKYLYRKLGCSPGSKDPKNDLISDCIKTVVSFNDSFDTQRLRKFSHIRYANYGLFRFIFFSLTLKQDKDLKHCYKDLEKEVEFSQYFHGSFTKEQLDKVCEYFKDNLNVWEEKGENDSLFQMDYSLFSTSEIVFDLEYDGRLFLTNRVVLSRLLCIEYYFCLTNHLYNSFMKSVHTQNPDAATKLNKSLVMFIAFSLARRYYEDVSINTDYKKDEVFSTYLCSELTNKMIHRMISIFMHQIGFSFPKDLSTVPVMIKFHSIQERLSENRKTYNYLLTLLKPEGIALILELIKVNEAQIHVSINLAEYRASNKNNPKQRNQWYEEENDLKSKENDLLDRLQNNKTLRTIYLIRIAIDNYYAIKMDEARAFVVADESKHKEELTKSHNQLRQLYTSHPYVKSKLELYEQLYKLDEEENKTMKTEMKDTHYFHTRSLIEDRLDEECDLDFALYKLRAEYLYAKEVLQTFISDLEEKKMKNNKT